MIDAFWKGPFKTSIENQFKIYASVIASIDLLVLLSSRINNLFVQVGFDFKLTLLYRLLHSILCKCGHIVLSLLIKHVCIKYFLNHRHRQRGQEEQTEVKKKIQKEHECPRNNEQTNRDQ